MSCQDFGPTMEKFCADPKDFVNERQIIEMATFKLHSEIKITLEGQASLMQ